MPIPSPNTGESRSNFIGRCVSFLVNEGRSDEQAFAICYDQYEEANKAEEAQKARIWKAFDNKRKAFESYATDVFHKALKKSIKPYLDEVIRTQSFDVDIDLMYKEEPIVEAYEKVYLKVMKPFALETYNQYVKKAKKTGVDWEKLIKEWLKYNTTSKIAGVDAYTKKRVLKQVERALIDGLSVDDFARRILPMDFAFSMDRARRIGRTEIIAGSNMGSLMGAKESGTKLMKKWLSSRDDRVRSHIKGNMWDHFAPERDQPIAIDDPFVLTGIDGRINYLLVPSDDSLGADASNTINCRCTQIYVEPEQNQSSDVLEEDIQIEELANALAVSVSSVTNRKTFIEFVEQFDVRIEKLPRNITNDGFKEMAKQHQYLVDTLGEHPQSFKQINSITSKNRWGEASPNAGFHKGYENVQLDGYVKLNSMSKKFNGVGFWELDSLNTPSTWNQGSSYMSTYIHEMIHHYDFTYSMKKHLGLNKDNVYKHSTYNSWVREKKYLSLSSEIAEEMIEIHGKEKFLEIAESMGRYVTYAFNKDKDWAELVTLAFERHYSGFRDENTDFIVKRFIEKYKGQK